MEAVEQMADRFGVELKYEQSSPEEEHRRQQGERVRELLDRACGFYEASFWKSPEAAAAREYLLGRGFPEELIRKFRVGWAPSSGAALAGRAIQEGFSRDQLSQAGLARVRGGSAEDFFRSRITFPISDARGRVQGFGARTMDPNERAKYVNSPEGDRFHKRELLFGLDLARQWAAKAGFAVVSEGYTDVMALHMAGIEGAVACMGTALTPTQLRLLARVVSEVRLCFDGDQAGEEAARRTIDAARGIPLRLAVVALPPGADPGELAGTPGGLGVLAQSVDDADPLIPWLVDRRIARAGESPAERERALTDLAGLLEGVPESADKDEAIRRVTALGVSPALLEQFVRRVSAGGGQRVKSAPIGEQPAPQPSLDEMRERHLLALAMAVPDEGRPLLQGMNEAHLGSDTHRRARSLIIENATVWPDDLSALHAALAAEAADGGSGEELRDAYYRVEKRALESAMIAARAAGDETEYLRLQATVKRIEVVLRGAA